MILIIIKLNHNDTNNNKLDHNDTKDSKKYSF